ncbi:hypothetical protein ACP70R_020373 [Stipagrostis hirtigluma subsp. patula]
MASREKKAPPGSKRKAPAAGSSPSDGEPPGRRAPRVAHAPPGHLAPAGIHAPPGCPAPPGPHAPPGPPAPLGPHAPAAGAPGWSNFGTFSPLGWLS